MCHSNATGPDATSSFSASAATVLLAASSRHTARPSTMQFGKTSRSVLGHALLRVPVFVRMVHGLHGLPTSIPRQYSGCHCPLGVCKPCSGSGWVAITFPGILVVGKVSPGCIGYAHCVLVKTRVMNSMLCLSAQGCRMFVTDIKACLESMQLPCFNSCGKMTFVVLPCLSLVAATPQCHCQ